MFKWRKGYEKINSKRRRDYGIFLGEGSFVCERDTGILWWAKTTFQYFVYNCARIGREGLLAHHTYGNTYQYYAVVSESDFSKRTLKSVISKYFNNSYLSAVSSLVKEEDISLDDLKKLIQEVEQKNEE